MRIAIILSILVAVAFAQTKPVWYPAASASVLVEGWTERREDRHLFRWFYDETLGKERIDGAERFLEEWYWTNRIVDTKAKSEQYVVHQGSLILCFQQQTNQSLPHPNLSNILFAGKAEIDYVVVNLWIERNALGREVARIFSRADNGKIVRIDHSSETRPRAISVHFHEFDAGAQDPSLFQLPSQIIAICNQRP